jgi:hypothetical protein
MLQKPGESPDAEFSDEDNFSCAQFYPPGHASRRLP